MKKSSRAIIWAMIFAGLLTVTGRADEAKLSALQTALSNTTISGYAGISIGYSTAQSNTLALLDDAERLHWPGIAGQVLLVSSTNHTREFFACQTTLYVSTSSRGRTSLVGQFTTAEDGTFVLRLAPGTYVIAPFLPELDLPLSSSPVVVKVLRGKITPVEINIFEGRNRRTINSSYGNIYGFESNRSKWQQIGSVPPTILPPTPIGLTQQFLIPSTPLPLPPYYGSGGTLIIQ